MKTAIVLIAHGSRQQTANADLIGLAKEMRDDGPYEIVEPAFLELARPTIAQAAGRCVKDGAGRVVLLPCFLSAGVHVTRDLQAWRKRLEAEHRDVEWLVAEPIGRHPLLRKILLARAREAESPQPDA